MCRVSESHMYSAVWYRMYVLTPYTRANTVQALYGILVL